MVLCHDDVIKWEHFPRYWPFVRGIHRSTVNSPHKGQRRGALMFSLISAWINSWVNTREAGDLRRQRTHSDVSVMVCFGVVIQYIPRNMHTVLLCFALLWLYMQSFIMNSYEVFIHIHQGCFAGTGAIVRLPQCQWSKPDGYGKISQCITTTKHSKAKTVCIFLGIYCTIIVSEIERLGYPYFLELLRYTGTIICITLYQSSNPERYG